MANKVIYVLDTNVLIYDPESIFGFEHGLVGIPVIVLEELDRFKTESSQRGYNSREIIRQLDLLRQKGSLRDGVKLENGGELKVLFEIEKYGECPIPFKEKIIDNQILLVAYCLKDKGFDVKFVSKDINARVKADVLNIESLDYVKETLSKEQLYKGWQVIKVPAAQLKKEFPDELKDLSSQFFPNEFILLESQHNPFNYRVFRYLSNGHFRVIENPGLKWSLAPKNAQQLMALDLLLDPDIQLVNLIGPAGTGKTFLALLAGLHQVIIEQRYEKILVSRPVIPLGPDIGYLPGDIQEKLLSWMQPVYDNMEFIIHYANTGQFGIYKGEEELESGFYKPRDKKKRKKLITKFIPSLDELIEESKISLEAITYMRGRSIPYQFILIDEVQNLTPHEVKTLITRVGEGSKIILAGDPYQIDSPYLDFSSNGLVVATDKFKGTSIFGSVYLEISERSELSRLAGELL